MVQITRPATSDTVSSGPTTPTFAPSSTFPLKDASDIPLTLHPTTRTGLIAKIQPPHSPGPSLPRTPVDIVLAIDVSGSMGSAAPVPGGADEPNYGFSVLDLTKHAALTILETLGEGDRLGIVTFSNKARVLRELQVVDGEHKAACRREILGMRPDAATSLWRGITKGLELFEGGEGGRNPALLVLTDGMPNSQCPPQGYVPKMQQMGPLPAAIHTFGFGHSLRSGLLKCIADVGGGSYNYIPDSSMLGTVFIHAVANLQSTYANAVTLKLRFPPSLELDVAGAQGLLAAGVDTAEGEADGKELTEVTLRIGALLYGQSRDLYLHAKHPEAALKQVEATLLYSRMTPAIYAVSSTPGAPLSPEEEAYHVSRSQVLNALGSLYRLSLDMEYNLAPLPTPERPAAFSSLPATLPAAKFSTDPRNASLLAELDASSDGQIPLAASEEFFGRWGAHYLLGLKSAHERQACNSFKDRGPLMYGVDSPLFVKCRDILDEVFDNLEAPEPSRTTTYTGPRHMSKYRNVAGPCFAEGTAVKVPGGVVGVEELRRGMVVVTPVGERRVGALLKTPVERQVVCRVGDVLVTPWHPILVSGGATSWVFPAEATSDSLLYSGAVYSVLLEEGESDGHAIAVGEQGLMGVTLGHGVVEDEDVRVHAFLGDHAAVRTELGKLGQNGVPDDGVVLGGGVRRDEKGLVCGFVPYVPAVKAGTGLSGLGMEAAPRDQGVTV